MLLAKVQELQNSIPELEVKCDNLAEKEQQLREVIERLENEKAELITKQSELVTERDNLLTRCEEFTQTIYEYDVEKITMAGKMEEMQNKLEVNSMNVQSVFSFSINKNHSFDFGKNQYSSDLLCRLCSALKCLVYRLKKHCGPFYVVVNFRSVVANVT